MSCRQSYICNTWFADFFLIILGLIILLGLWALLGTHKSARLCNAYNSYQTMLIRFGILSNSHRPGFGLWSSVNTKNCCLYLVPQSLTCFYSLVYSDLSTGQLTVFTGYISLEVLAWNVTRKMCCMQTRLHSWSILCWVLSEEAKEDSSSPICTWIVWVWSVSYWAVIFWCVIADQNQALNASITSQSMMIQLEWLVLDCQRPGFCLWSSATSKGLEYIIANYIG